MPGNAEPVNLDLLLQGVISRRSQTNRRFEASRSRNSAAS